MAPAGPSRLGGMNKVAAVGWTIGVGQVSLVGTSVMLKIALHRPSSQICLYRYQQYQIEKNSAQLDIYKSYKLGSGAQINEGCISKFR